MLGHENGQRAGAGPHVAGLKCDCHLRVRRTLMRNPFSQHTFADPRASPVPLPVAFERGGPAQQARAAHEPVGGEGGRRRDEEQLQAQGGISPLRGFEPKLYRMSDHGSHFSCAAPHTKAWRFFTVYSRVCVLSHPAAFVTGVEQRAGGVAGAQGKSGQTVSGGMGGRVGDRCPSMCTFGGVRSRRVNIVVGTHRVVIHLRHQLRHGCRVAGD